MVYYTVEERVFIVKQFYSNNKSPITVQRDFAKEYQVRQGPAASTITRLIEKFERTGSIADDFAPISPSVTVSTEENIEKIRECTKKKPTKITP